MKKDADHHDHLKKARLAELRQRRQAAAPDAQKFARDLDEALSNLQGVLEGAEVRGPGGFEVGGSLADNNSLVADIVHEGRLFFDRVVPLARRLQRTSR